MATDRDVEIAQARIEEEPKEPSKSWRSRTSRLMGTTAMINVRSPFAERAGPSQREVAGGTNNNFR
jgi:hypothetical protein